MLENVRYENHLAQTIHFDGSEGIYLAHGDIRDYTWTYETENRRVSKLYKDIRELTLPIKILSRSKELRNRLDNILEADSATNTQGRLWFDDYYLTCYPVNSAKALYKPDRLPLELRFVTDSPYWIREITRRFETKSITSGLKYPKRYSYRYTDYAANVSITNDTLIPSPFILTIYGAVENPDITIGDQRYMINTSIAEGEYLTLNGTGTEEEKTITITGVKGAKRNVFNDRLKTVDVFKHVPPGTYEVAWAGDYVFDLTIFDQRSAPPWS